MRDLETKPDVPPMNRGGALDETPIHPSDTDSTHYPDPSEPCQKKLDCPEESSLDPATKRFGEETRDVVEEGSWESFPASDPPSWAQRAGRSRSKAHDNT